MMKRVRNSDIKEPIDDIEKTERTPYTYIAITRKLFHSSATAQSKIKLSKTHSVHISRMY